MTLRPFGPGSGVAVVVLVLAILGALAVIPFTPMVVFGLIAAMCLTAFF